MIEYHWGAGASISQIAGMLDVAVSTISREISRYHSARHGTKNPRGGWLPPGRRGNYRWGYRADWAQRRAGQARRRPKPRLLWANRVLRELVVDGLARRWSPRQISRRLVIDFADRPDLRVCAETIYQAIYLQARGSLRELVDDALRSGRRQRRRQSRAATAARAALRAKPWVSEQVHISARPAQASDRAVPGHWEGDLVIGAGGRSAIVTLVERTTRYTMLGALPVDRSSPEVITVLRTLMARLPAALAQSITWDQGSELSEHAQFTLATGCPVFFCDPHHPWQRGSNENTNGLLRQYFPKGRYDFTTIDQHGLDIVAAELNDRPRETLDFHTPAERLTQLLASNNGDTTVALTP
nr:IS30 family transposase [Actinocatenispora thailandica]